MSQAKNKRAYKRQKGQFLTPQLLARDILADIEFDVSDRVLEPGFGDGSFLLPMIEAFLELYEGPASSRLEHVLNNNIWGVEIDPVMYDKALLNIEERIGPLPASHNLLEGDYFETLFEGQTLRPDLEKGSFGYNIEFTHIIGNPPFGGTIASHLQVPWTRCSVGDMRTTGLTTKPRPAWYIVIRPTIYIGKTMEMPFSPTRRQATGIFTE